MKDFLDKHSVLLEDKDFEIQKGLQYLVIDAGLSENAPQSEQRIISDFNLLGLDLIALSRKSIEPKNSHGSAKPKHKYFGSRMTNSTNDQN